MILRHSIGCIKCFLIFDRSSRHFLEFPIELITPEVCPAYGWVMMSWVAVVPF